MTNWGHHIQSFSLLLNLSHTYPRKVYICGGWRECNTFFILLLHYVFYEMQIFWYNICTLKMHFMDFLSSCLTFQNPNMLWKWKPREYLASIKVNSMFVWCCSNTYSTGLSPSRYFLPEQYNRMKQAWKQRWWRWQSLSHTAALRQPTFPLALPSCWP